MPFTDMLNRLKVLLTGICMIVISFGGICGIDSLIVLLFPRFLTPVGLIISFAIGGMLAAALSYQYGMEISTTRSNADKWSLLILQVICGLFCFFLLAKLLAKTSTISLSYNELDAAFKAFGSAMAMGSLLLIKIPPANHIAR